MPLLLRGSDGVVIIHLGALQFNGGWACSDPPAFGPHCTTSPESPIVPSADAKSSAKQASSEATVTPSGSITRTRGRALPAPQTCPERPRSRTSSATASDSWRSPLRGSVSPRRTNDLRVGLGRSRPIRCAPHPPRPTPANRHNETTAPSAMSSPPLPRGTGSDAKYPLPARREQGFGSGYSRSQTHAACRTGPACTGSHHGPLGLRRQIA